MARVLVLGKRPYHLSPEEADAWLRREGAQLVDIESIERVEFTQLRSASRHFPASWSWMLVLHVRDGVDAAACLDGGVCAELLLDLRLLGMLPTVVLAEGSEPLLEES